MNSIDAAIAQIYRTASQGTQGYRRRALAELAQILDFDGALWGTGRHDSDHFHSVDILGVQPGYPAALENSRENNPILKAFLSAPGRVIDMMDVMPDDQLYQSDLYLKFFKRFGVERIMGIIVPDESSGIITLISLYRFDRHNPFTSTDRQLLSRMAFHLISGASHAYFLHLTLQNSENKNSAMAICDQHGLFFEVQPKFMALLDTHFPQRTYGRLPFELDGTESTLAEGKLCIESEALGDLICVSIRESSPIDILSAREQQVVSCITQGLSFKEAARKMGVAPSTVSNHLYKIYRKLHISSRTELAELTMSER